MVEAVEVAKISSNIAANIFFAVCPAEPEVAFLLGQVVADLGKRKMKSKRRKSRKIERTY